MLNDKEISYINLLSEFLPDRHGGSRGPKPISKYVLITELFKLCRCGLNWRRIEHSTTVRRYMEECQRRGLYKKFFKNLNSNFKKYRPKRSIVDSTEVESFNFRKGVSYSGKSHKYAAKITVEINDEYIPLSVQFAKGSSSESKEFDRLLSKQDKLPYEMTLDMGYEKYARRRDLKKRGCQVHMEQKIKKDSRKRGPQFSYTDEDKRERSKIERFFSWIQSFWRVRFRREMKEGLFSCFSIHSFYLLYGQMRNLEHVY